MFTLRFEHDTRVSGSGDVTMVVSTPKYRTRRQNDGSVDVLIPNENGVEIAEQVNGSVGCWDRCYVMNASGATVDKIKPDTGVTRRKAPEHLTQQAAMLGACADNRNAI